MPQMKISVSYLHCTSDISQTMSTYPGIRRKFAVVKATEARKWDAFSTELALFQRSCLLVMRSLVGRYHFMNWGRCYGKKHNTVLHYIHFSAYCCAINEYGGGSCQLQWHVITSVFPHSQVQFPGQLIFKDGCWEKYHFTFLFTSYSQP